MPAKVQIIVDAVDKASRELKGVNKEVKGLGGASKKASAGTKLLGAGMGALAGYFTLAFARQIGQVALELGELGARAESLRGSLTSLAGGAEEAAEYIRAVRDASLGTISEMDAMQASITAQTLGVVENAQQMQQLTEVAVTLGRAQGITATGRKVSQRQRQSGI